ncbi:probable pectin methylesterase CGR3 [Vigna unguiculata]|uniref:S-adenosyl-L-methionine-dependent methyltransferase n=1 Tax=Vigna unguiculata TaxID=3917 RepID=A0A4D6NTY4_VIGUN|nr:probable pectin methylesterase CGR3 [Vigna unguiculata]XP_027905418.1 probable pectin methylesterase CGR3 [Vigna unguiculata]XP_027905419.1 probable pectin methylesterase CGR3 [Vigna unguiculata]QCE16432.1 S-adenosyl-L-methionine-dependent methyltransferase [Vigna unguiculata]
MMSRRPVNLSRRFGDSGGGLFSSSKSKTSPALSVGLIIVGGLFLIGYVYKGSGGFGSRLESVSRLQGDYLCTGEVPRAIPILKKAYGDSLHKVLHVGPDTCYVVSKLLKEEETEAWGIEPYDIEDADANCKALIRKGIVRMADIKFPLPYRPKAFSLVVISDALDFLSPRYLNKTLPDLARISTDGIVIFTGYPDNKKAKGADVSKYGKTAKMRSSSWWVRYFLQINLEENDAASKKFAQASTKSSYVPNCQIFHLKSLN